jgi:hypothetical protein
MLTFSINNSTTLQAVAYPLPQYLTNLLNTFQDNETKLISPQDLRDLTLSLYSFVPFKETTASGSSTYYVGLDYFNPSDRSQNSYPKKLYFGKRAFSGTYSYTSSHDIMNSTLLSSDTDVFFFNTRSDFFDQDFTRIPILAGDKINLFNNAPYIQTQRVIGDNETLSFDFVNLNGKIDVRSNTSYVSVNNLKFPTIVESGLSASNGRALKYVGTGSSASLYWDDLTYPLVRFIGTTYSRLDIYGLPFNINGYPFQFSDTRKISYGINDLKLGADLNNVPLTDLIRRLIYPTLKPTCSIEILPPFDSGYTEVGTYPIPTVRFTINKKTNPTQITSLTNMIPGVYPPITNPEYTNVTSTSTGIVISPIGATSTEFKIAVGDGIVGTSSATATLTGIYPYFFGFSSLTSMTTIGLGPLTKVVEPKSDKTFNITGTGNLYFAYPKIYGTLSAIVDPGGYTASGSFSYTTQNLSSPTGLWASEEYYVYKWSSATPIGPPGSNYELMY